MKWGPSEIVQECEAADRLRDKILESLDDRLGRYYGTAYGLTDGEYWPENYYFTWVSYILPQIVFQNPRVKIGSQRLDEVVNEAKALQIAVNRWIRDTDHRTHLRQMGFDLGFSYGVSFTRPVAVPWLQGADKDDVAWRPQCERINQRLFAIDPVSDGPWNARYMTHTVIDDRDRMLEWASDHPEEGWNKKAIKAAGGCTPFDLTRQGSDVPDRGQIAYRVVWCPEVDSTDKDDDPESYHGTIYTIDLNPSSGKEIEWLREPYAFMGPRWGPYTVFGAYTVPGCPYPLAPLVANEAAFKEVNALSLANFQSARNRKTIGLYDKVNETEAGAIAKAPAWGTVGITGFDRNKFAEMKLGGIDQVDVAQLEMARAMAERGIGINASQQGQIDTGSLATEITAATAASNVRTSDNAEQMVAGTRRELTTVAWYMHKFDKVRVPLTNEDKAELLKGAPPEVLEQMMKVPLEWSGKDNKMPFDAMELEIEPYSMKRTDEPMMQARAMQAIQLGVEIGPAVIANPHIRFKELLKKAGDAMNWPGFEDILDEEKASVLQAVALQSQMVQPETTPTPSAKPRLAGDSAKPPAQGFRSPAGAEMKTQKPSSTKAPAMAGGKR